MGLRHALLYWSENFFFFLFCSSLLFCSKKIFFSTFLLAGVRNPRDPRYLMAALPSFVGVGAGPLDGHVLLHDSLRAALLGAMVCLHDQHCRLVRVRATKKTRRRNLAGTPLFFLLIYLNFIFKLSALSPSKETVSPGVDMLPV